MQVLKAKLCAYLTLLMRYDMALKSRLFLSHRFSCFDLSKQTFFCLTPTKKMSACSRCIWFEAKCYKVSDDFLLFLILLLKEDTSKGIKKTDIILCVFILFSAQIGQLVISSMVPNFFRKLYIGNLN